MALTETVKLPVWDSRRVREQTPALVKALTEFIGGGSEVCFYGGSGAEDWQRGNYKDLFVITLPRPNAPAVSCRRYEAQLPKWVGEFYELAAAGSNDEAMDVAFENIDAMLLGERFTECQSLLDALDVGRLDAELLVSLLSITKPAKQHLPLRTTFLTRVASRLKELVPDRADGLIAKLH